MKGVAEDLALEYASILKAYLTKNDESCLQRAYELGRLALSENVGLLQMTELHNSALTAVLEEISQTSEGARARRSGQIFLLEVLSAFEMARQQCQDATTALRRLNETLETEVKRIAFALHEEAAQLLVSADLVVDEVAREVPVSLRSRLDKIRVPLQQCGSALRRLSHELRPPVLDDLGLVPALEFLAEGVSNRIGIPIMVTGSTDGRLPLAVETAIYRIAQEALSNVARHAQASHVAITTSRSGAIVQCTVRDDGVGFDTVAALSPPVGQRGLGLFAIRDRLNAVGGTYKVVSAPGRGTELFVSIPVAVTGMGSR